MVARYGSFTPARRAALRRAQLASAAKRRGRGKGKYIKRAAIGAGIVGVGAAAAYGGHYHVKESALKKKHGNAYLKPKQKVYHYTSRSGHKSILKTKNFKVKQRYGLPGSKTGVWFTTQKRDNRAAMQVQYGNHIVKTKVKRKHVQRNIEPFSNKNHRWLMVDQKHVNGRRIKSHYRTKPPKGARARARRVARIKR